MGSGIKSKAGSSSTSSSKGVAIGKRAKISSAQKNMLVAVGATSMLLGVTIVGVIYLTKKISFNSVIVSENDAVIKDLKTTQDNLVRLSTAVSDLASNEKLESVALERDKVKCDAETLKKIMSEDGYSLDNIEMVRTCSALRVVADTLPSTENHDASNSSINWLVIRDDHSIKLEGISNASSYGGFSVASSDGQTLNLKALGTSISIKDSATKVNRAISSIESSIRNFDIESANISWSGYDRGADNSEIEFGATYRSYYSDKVGLQKNSKVICADKTSKKCASKTGGSTSK